MQGTCTHARIHARICFCDVPLLLSRQLMRRMTYNTEDGSWSLRTDAAPAPTQSGQGSAARRPASARQPGSRFRATGPVLFLDADTPQLRSLDLGGMPWALA